MAHATATLRHRDDTVTVAAKDVAAIRASAQEGAAKTTGRSREEALALLHRTVELDGYFAAEPAAVAVNLTASTFTAFQRAMIRAAGVTVGERPAPPPRW